METKVGENNKRWSLEGMTALVTGGTRGIGYVTIFYFIIIMRMLYADFVLTMFMIMYV